MHDFGVKLHAPDLPLGTRNGAIGRIGRETDRLEAGRHAHDTVAVAHPDVGGLAAREAVEDPGRLVDRHLRETKLAFDSALHLSAEEMREELHAVTDAEDRDAELEDTLVELRRTLL